MMSRTRTAAAVARRRARHDQESRAAATPAARLEEALRHLRSIAWLAVGDDETAAAAVLVEDCATDLAALHTERKVTLCHSQR